MFTVSTSGGTTTVTGVTFTATSASLNLGGAVNSTIGSVTGSYNVTTKAFTLNLSTVNISFSSFLSISAASATINYTGTSSIAVGINDSTANGGAGPTSANVSLLTIGIGGASIFAGVGGTAANPTASGAEGFSVSGVNLALALMYNSANSVTYYGVVVSGTGASVKTSGVLKNFTASISNFQVDVNGASSGDQVVNFAWTKTDFGSGAGNGLSVPVGTGTNPPTVTINLAQPEVQVSATFLLNLGGLVYVSGSLTFQQDAITPITNGGTLVLNTGASNATIASSVVIGANNVNIFVGVNGPASDMPSGNANAVGMEITGASFALAIITDSNGVVYYGAISNGDATIKADGMPANFTLTASNLQVEINDSSAGSGQVLNFDATFGVGTGLAVPLSSLSGGPTLNLDFEQYLLEGSGTFLLNLDNFIYVSGNLTFLDESVAPNTPVQLASGTTTATVASILEIGGSNLTIFAGVNGPAPPVPQSNANAIGLQLTGASFAVALVTDSNGAVYYGAEATAASLALVGLPSGFNLTAQNLQVEADGTSNGSYLNFDTTFNGPGLAVATGGGNSTTIDFQNQLLEVSGNLTIQFTSYINITGAFDFIQTSTATEIQITDATFTFGSSTDLFFSATASLDLTITATTTTIDTASLTITSVNNQPDVVIIPDVLEAVSPTIILSNINIDNATGQISGSGSANAGLTIQAASATLLPGNSTINATVSATPNGDGLGVNGVFNLQTGAFSLTLEQLSLKVGSVLQANASNVVVCYFPNGGLAQQLVSIASGQIILTVFGTGSGEEITGQITNLVIYGDGFQFASLTVSYTGNINVGSILTLENPSFTLTNFSVTFGGGNASFNETGSLTLSVGSAALNIGSSGSGFSASAQNLSITVALDPADLGNTTITADTVALQFGSYITIQASGISINTSPTASDVNKPSDGNAYLSVASATVALSLGSSGPSLTGTASNFSVIKSDGTDGVAAGTVELREDNNFGISISANPGDLHLPSWLGFQITSFSISWSNFASDPADFVLTLSASINSIQGLPGGVTVSGSIQDAVIDIGKLEQGEFPITSLGAISGSVSGTLFGLQVNASFVLGIVNLNAENQIVNSDGSLTNPTTGAVTAAGSGVDKTIVSSTIYVGVAGGAQIPGVGGVEIYIGFSQYGPLTVYLSAQFPLILDPDTGLAIGGFSGGVIFDYTLPTPGQPTDLRNIALSPANITISQWQQQLEMQTVTQVAATSSGVSAYSQPFVIEAGVTLYDAYLTQDSFKITGNIAIQINPSQPNDTEIYVEGTAVLGNSVSFNAYLYANLAVNGTATTASFMFLVDEPASTPIESFGGSLTFGFTDSNGNPITPAAPTTTTSTQTITMPDGSTHTYTATTFNTPSENIGGFYISLSGFLEYSALGFASVSITGGVTLTVTGTEAKLDLLGMLNVSFLGDIATAQGEFVINYANTSSPQFYGALEVSTGAALAKLQSYGLTVDGAILFQINTTGADQTVNLPNAPPANQTSTSGVSAPLLNGSNSTAFTIQGSVLFDLTITGTSSQYATITYETNNITLFTMKGFFDLRLTNDPTLGLGLEMFADVNTLTLGSGSSTFLTFSGFGLFVINSQGLAAEINLTLNSGNAISGISFSANFDLVINTTSQAVTFNIPSVTVPTSSSGSTGVSGVVVYNPDGSVAGTVTSLIIPAGPPQGSLEIINNAGTYATSGAAGPYIVVTGSGTINLESLTLNGYFYFQLSDSPSTGFILSLVVNVSGNVPSVGTASVTGALQISSAGEVALLAIGGTAGSTDNYGADVSLQVTAELAINTTSSNVSEIGGVPLTYNGQNVTVMANTVQVIASGVLTLNIGGGTGFVISGTFSTTNSNANGVSITTITVNGVLTATVGGSTLLTMNANGILVLASNGPRPGMAGELTLTLNGSNPLAGNGFTLNGSFDLEVNTTGVQQKVNVGTTTTTIAAGPDGATTGGDYVEVHARGNLVFGTTTNGFLLNNGDFYLAFGSQGLAVSASATMAIEVGGTLVFSATASGGMLISSSGFAASVTVASTLSDPSGLGLYAFGGTFTLQVNTTGTQQIIGSGSTAVVVAAGPGASGSPAGPYFQMYVSGSLALGTTNTAASTGMFLVGGFYLVISNSGLTVAANGTLSATVGGSTLITLTASGALILTTSGSNPGLAGELTLTLNGSDPLEGSGLFAFTGTFTLQVNTTGVQQTVTVGSTTTTITAGANGSSVSGPYIEVDANGSLISGTAADGLSLTGGFYLSVSTTGLVVSTNVAFEATVAGTALLTMNASGVLIISAGSNPGLAGDLVLTLNGANPLDGIGFTFNGTFDLQINTTGAQQTVTVGSSTTTIAAGPNGSTTPSDYVEVHAAGNLTFGVGTNGFILNNGNFYLAVSSNGLAVSASATLAIEVGGEQIFSLAASGGMLISSSGFAASLTVTSGANTSLNDPTSLSFYSFTGTFTLQVNTTGVQQTIGIGSSAVVIPAGPGTNGIPVGPYFQLIINGTLSLGSSTVTDTGMFVTGQFYLVINSAGLTVTVNGVLNAEVAGSTLLTMNATGVLILSTSQPNPGLAGELTITLSSGSPLSGAGFNFNGSFVLEINTTEAQQTVTVGSTTVTIAAGQNGSSTPAAYVEVYASGAIIFGTASNGFALTGGFYLSVGTTGLFVSTNVNFTATVVGVTMLTMSASGVMEITSAGLAAKFSLSISGGGNPLSMANVFTFNGAFYFEINTTNQAINDTIGNVTLSLPKGPYFQMAITGTTPGSQATLTLGSVVGLQLVGGFVLTIGSNGLAVTATASLNLFVGSTTLLSFTADGALLITPTGIAAKITLTSGIGISGSEFDFSASFVLEVNSTGSAVSKINNTTVNLPQGPYFEIIANGSLVLSSLAQVEGSFVFTLTSSGVQFSINAVVDLFGIYFTVNGFAGFYSDGIALSISLTTGGSADPTVTIIPEAVALSGTFLLQVNTTPGTNTFVINGVTYNIAAKTYFDVSISASLDVWGFSLGKTSMDIKVNTNGYFEITGNFQFNFFGFVTTQLDYEFDSNNNFWIYASASVQLGSSSFNIHGTLTFEIASATGFYDPYSNVTINNTFYVYISGGATAFGWNFGSIDASLSINGSDVSFSVGVYVSFYFFSIGGTVTIDLGSIGPRPPAPPPPALGTVLTSGTTIDGQYYGAGTLLLNLGQYANANRGVGPLPTEDYTVTYVGPGTGGTEDVDVTAQGVYGSPVEYDNVTKIVVPNADNGVTTSNVTVDIANAVLLPTFVYSGSGTNVYYMGGYNGTGTDESTVNGSYGIDTVIGGSGAFVFNVGAGSSIFIGGTANSIINNAGDQPLAIYQGNPNDNVPANLPTTVDYNNYDLNGDILSYSLTGGSTYSDTINGEATIVLTAAATGTAAFTVENFPGSALTVTMDGNGNANASVAVTNKGNLNLNGDLIGVNGAEITLQSIPTVSLIGSTSGDQITVTNSADIPTVNLIGNAGNDVFTVNFQGGITYAINVSASGSGNTLMLNGTNTNNTYGITATKVTFVGETVAYLGVQNLVLNAGKGNDTVNVQSVGNATTVNLGPGTNEVNVGTLAPNESNGTLNAIKALLTIVGGKTGTNTLYLDDSGDATAATATLTNSTLTGIFGANGSLAYSNITTFNLYLGSGNHTVNVQGMNNVVNIALGNGVNIINIGSAAGPIITDPTTGDATNTGSVLDQVLGVLNLTGTGANTVNVDDSGETTGVDAAMTPTSLEFLNLFTVNLPTVVAINISLSQGNDVFAVSDTFTSTATSPVIVIDGNGGSDTFIILDTHAVMTINGGDDADFFYNFGNSSVLYLNGDAGDDTFYIYASVNENTSNLNPGGADASGNQVYSYRVNAAVNIDGGSGNDALYIFGTPYNDVITINGNSVTGAGLDVNFTEVEQLYVVGLGGNDTFYIESITIPTTIIGDGSVVPAPSLAVLQQLGVAVPNVNAGTPGSDTFYVGWQGASYIPGTLANIDASLTIYGDNGPNNNGTTTNVPGTNDTIYVDDSGDTAGHNFTLTSTTLTSDAFGTGGSLIYDSAVENLNINTSTGNNTVTIDGTGTATQTSIYGGPGNDTFIVNATNGGSLASPLALFGGLNTFAGDTLTVNGAPQGNTFDVTGFTIDGAGATISYEQFEKLTINAGGATTINVNGDSTPTYLNGGNIPDTFNINSSVAPLYIAGGLGNDTINVNANSSTLIATGGLSQNVFTVNGNGGTVTLNGAGIGDSFIINGNSGGLTVNGGAGNDYFTVYALSAPATFNAGTGQASFLVYTPLAASLTINGVNPANDLLTINGTTGNDYFTITNGTVSGVGAAINYSAVNLVVDGIAGNDTFVVQSTSAATTWVYGGAYGNDTFDIQGTTGALYVSGGSAGNNYFNLGSEAPVSGGSLAYLNGPVFITGGAGIMRLITLASPGTNILNVDDSGDFVNDSGTLTASTLTGLGMGAAVTFVSVNVMNIDLGRGDTTFNIQSTNSTTVTTLTSGVGPDIINLGSLAPFGGGTTNAIQGALIIVGNDNDTVNVDDTGNATGQTGTLTATTLTGLGLGVSGVVYTGLTELNINLGSGNDTFNVQSTNAITVTTINTGAGANVINVGSLAPVTGGITNGIQGSLVIVGSGNDTLNVDDTGNTSGQSGTLSATALTGLGMGASGLTYSGLAVLNLTLGSGNDNFTITGVTNTTRTTINGGAGTNNANLNIVGDFAGQNLTLLNFATAIFFVSGNFSGLFNDAGALTTVTIGGSLTGTGMINAGSIGAMTIGGNLVGLLNVTGLLGTLTVDGAAPGQIIVGSTNVIVVLAGYGNTLLNITEGGIQREILATPVLGITIPTTVHFAFVYDSETAATPQLAIRITDSNPIARSYNLALIVVNSSTAKFDLTLLDSYLNHSTGISNISVEGDLLTKLTAPELNIFTDLTATSRAGVVLPADKITGVEVSDILPVGFIDVAGLEGLAFAAVTTATGTPINVSTPIGQGSSLENLLGSNAVVDPANDPFVVVFNSNQPVRFYVHDNISLDLEQVMTLTDELNNGQSVIAYIEVLPTTSKTVNPLIEGVALMGNGGSINSTLSIANITSTGALGDVTVSGSSGTTVNNTVAGLGNVTATSIFGSIDVTNAGIYGVIQATNGDIGQATLNASGQITAVTSIVSNGAFSGQIISQGNLVSSVKTNGAFSGLIAAQGDIGAIQRSANGNAVTSAANALTRFGGITISGNDSGQVVTLGNIFGNVTISGTMTGRIAAEGQAIAGLAATRFGILGNVSVSSFAAGSAIISGGLIGDATGKTTLHLGSAKGFVAAEGSVNLLSTTIAAANLLQNVQSGANFSAINAIFTNNGLPLLFNTGGVLDGLSLILADLADLVDNSGVLSGTIP